jgi:hypothetical protein
MLGIFPNRVLSAHKGVNNLQAYSQLRRPRLLRRSLRVRPITGWYFSGCPIGDPDRSFLAAVNTVVGLLRSDGGELWPTLIQTARSLIDRSGAIRVFPVKNTNLLKIIGEASLSN